MDSGLRQAARLVVIGPDDRVLLFRYKDGPRTWWATPGGGLEGEETFEEAAVREAVEELSLTEPRLTALWCQTVEFSFRGQWIRQVERYFLVRLSSEDVALDESLRKAHRLEGIVASRWWSLEEIEETPEPVFPEDLDDLGTQYQFPYFPYFGISGNGYCVPEISLLSYRQFLGSAHRGPAPVKEVWR